MQFALTLASALELAIKVPKIRGEVIPHLHGYPQPMQLLVVQHLCFVIQRGVPEM